jgi:hypothetical protein
VGLIAGGAAALLALAAIGIVLATSSGSNPGLEVRALGCTPPAASITRHGAQTANYQFDSATGAVLQKGPVRFNGADTQQVSLPTKVPGRFTLRVTGSGQSQTVPFRC